MPEKNEKTVEELAAELLKAKTEPEMDDDGYAVGDPYAEMAKAIDKKKANPSLITCIGKSIIDNRDSVAVGEKFVKSLFGIFGLIYLAMSYEFSEKEAEAISKQNTTKELIDGFTNSVAVWDFMSREGVMLVSVVGLYFLAVKVNDSLDEIELEQYEKQQREMNNRPGMDVVEEEEESDSEEENEDDRK